MRRRVGGSVAAVSLSAVLILTGCSIGDIRRPPPDRAAPSTDATVPVGGPAVEVRPMRVPAGYDAPFIAFDDADHGYAFFHGCNARASVGVAAGCPSLLYATADGGRSWQHGSIRIRRRRSIRCWSATAAWCCPPTLPGTGRSTEV